MKRNEEEESKSEKKINVYEEIERDGKWKSSEYEAIEDEDVQ